jgi:hypothetical protein
MFQNFSTGVSPAEATPMPQSAAFCRHVDNLLVIPKVIGYLNVIDAAELRFFAVVDTGRRLLLPDSYANDMRGDLPFQNVIARSSKSNVL